MPQTSRFLGPVFVGPVYHPAGTPFSADDYLRAGHQVPTPEQLELWAAREKVRARRQDR